MRNPRLVGHVILGAGLGLAFLIARTAWSHDTGSRVWVESPLATRNGPVPVKHTAGGSRLRTLEACLDASGPERPQARQP